MILHNKINKEILKQKLMEESFKRITLSFYRYTKIEDPKLTRDELFIKWSEINVFGRIYLAEEGINAQLSVPEHNLSKFREILKNDQKFSNIPLKIAVEDDGKSFYKLAIKIKDKIVADGIDDPSFDTSNVGKHLTAKEFNQAMENPQTIVVDMRNHYESEVGHFENAICPDADTFREEIKIVKDLLQEKKDQKILLYCTGGIRCEKASAYLKHHGFQDVNQLLGGIIDYARQIKAENLPSKFKGKNFVFDERVGERITTEIISQCHQCHSASDEHTNCRNDACHLLFIQCQNCREKYQGCCSEKCQKIASLPFETQKNLRKNQKNIDSLSVYKSRLRPKLTELFNA